MQTCTFFCSEGSRLPEKIISDSKSISCFFGIFSDQNKNTVEIENKFQKLLLSQWTFLKQKRTFPKPFFKDTSSSPLTSTLCQDEPHCAVRPLLNLKNGYPFHSCYRQTRNRGLLSRITCTSRTVAYYKSHIR